jgi:hypothetical protein
MTPSSSYRFSDHTHRQLLELAQTMGTTATTVLTVAVDRLHRDLCAVPGEYGNVPPEYPVAPAKRESNA